MQKELPKSIVLFDHAKRTFGLDRAIHPQQDSLFTGDALQRCGALFNEFLGDVDLTVALCRIDFSIILFS